MQLRAPRPFPAIGLMALGLLAGCNSDGSTLDPGSSPAPSLATTGNGAPSGARDCARR